MIGVDISDRSIKIVQLSNDKSARRLQSYCWSDIEEDVIERGIIKEPNNTLDWCDYEDLIAIFINLKESSDPNHYSIDDLSSLLSGLSVNQNQQKHSQ